MKLRDGTKLSEGSDLSGSQPADQPASREDMANSSGHQAEREVDAGEEGSKQTSDISTNNSSTTNQQNSTKPTSSKKKNNSSKGSSSEAKSCKKRKTGDADNAKKAPDPHVVKMREEIRKLKRADKALKAQVETANKKIATQQGKITEKTTEVSSLKRKVTEFERRLAREQKKTSDLEHETLKAGEENLDASLITKKYKAAFDDADCERKRIKKQLEVAEKKLNAEKAKVSKVQGALDKLKEEKTAAKYQHEEKMQKMKVEEQKHACKKVQHTNEARTMMKQFEHWSKHHNMMSKYKLDTKSKKKQEKRKEKKAREKENTRRARVLAHTGQAPNMQSGNLGGGANVLLSASICNMCYTVYMRTCTRM